MRKRAQIKNLHSFFIHFHLIRRLRRHLPLKGEGKERSTAARGKNGFLRTLDTGLPQKLYPTQPQFASKFPLSYISAVRATTGAVSHRRMRAPMAQMCMPTLRAMSAS